MTRITCRINKGIHKKVTGREEKEDIEGRKDTYPWPRPFAHHQWPH